MPFWIGIALAVGSVILSYLLAPKPKLPKPDAVKDLENPTAEAGRPFPVVFGTVTIKSLNSLWYGQKSAKVTKVKA